MLRTFNTHRIRSTASLDGLWDFVTAPDRNDRGKLPKAYTHTLYVPSVWDVLPGLENYRGKAWLRRDVALPGGAAGDCAMRLVFSGVGHTGDAFVDGKHVGHHYDAFTPWAAIAQPKGDGPHELVVEVDNSFGDHSALHIPNDYMTYGGITRPVQIEAVPSVYIDKLFATPVRRGQSWSLDVKVRLHNWSNASATRHVTVDVAGKSVDLGSVTVKAGATRHVAGTLKVGRVDTWSPASPSLYEITATLFDQGAPVDDLIDRVGFREVKVKGDRILLNGKPIRLRGYNRHEDHPQFGSAIPVEAMMTDLQLMRDLGCNFVRTCHYPNDERFLDLCDELGFYVWEESHARTVSFDHPAYKQQITDSTVEMIEWHHNHPSIVMWGCLNECETRTKAGAREHKRVLDLIKKLDPSRPNTYAAMYRDADLAQGEPDIIAWNMYTGWYGGSPDMTRQVVDDMMKWLHSPGSRGGKGKPVIISEFGAGAIYGNRQPREAHWSEEYQSKVLEENLAVYLHHPKVSGAAIWQFCDVRLSTEWWNARPRNMNNKGTVDEYRRPKLVYDVVKRAMRDAAKKWDK